MRTRAILKSAFPKRDIQFLDKGCSPLYVDDKDELSFENGLTLITYILFQTHTFLLKRPFKIF